VTTARALEARLGSPVTAAFISAAEPRVPAAVDSVRASAPSGTRVVVATYLLAPGYFADLARASGGDLTSAPLLVDDGEAPPPELVEIVLERWRAGA
jgi:sirohydrochlorin ferrochelatase